MPEQARGSPTAAYYWTSVTLREFGAVFLSCPVVNLGMSPQLVPVGAAASRKA